MTFVEKETGTPVHVYGWHPDSPDDFAFEREVFERGYRYRHQAGWPTQTKTLEIRDPDIRYLGVGNNDFHQVFVWRFFVVVARLAGGTIGFAAASDKQDFLPLIEWLEEKCPKTAQTANGWRPVTFWFITGKGPKNITRRINIVDWDNVRINYTGDIREMMGTLIDKDWRPTTDGKLMLWRGVPGTGKTYAIRALMNAWSEWADFHYIVDPDAFFGASPEYLMNVVTNAEEDDDDLDPDFDVDEEMQIQKRWMVIVLEDAGELMTADAKERSGQALSRLLNLVDGFIGQGLRVILLITTNEEIGKLHPAVSRPGRCLMNQEFTTLTHAEVQEWAKAHQLETEPSTGRLADLYAMLKGKTVKGTQPVGFTGPF